MADHLDPFPVDAAREPGAERFHRRLFRSESRRKRRGRVAFAATVRDLALSEHASHEMVAEALDRRGNAVDLGGVHAGSYNVHRTAMRLAR